MHLRLLFSLTAVAGLAFAFAACSKSASSASTAKGAGPALTSMEQRVSYGIGYNVGSSIAREGLIVVDRDAIKAGLEDGLSKTPTRISEADLRAAFVALQQKTAAASTAAGEKQLAMGAAFLEKNRARSGVTVTASGLQYEVLAHGIGVKPKLTDTVEVHYHGTLLDGTVFDSSRQRGTPATFKVDELIAGWKEALQLMSVGDKYKLVVPANLGYGPRGSNSIPPNSVLVFDLELLGIK